MPRGKPGKGPHAGKGDQKKTVTYNAHYAKHSKKNHPGTNKKGK